MENLLFEEEIYSDSGMEEQLDNNEISSWEAGFMAGYNSDD